MDTLLLNGRIVAIDNARNLLELVRREGIHLPTFCYHSELSVYGACRLCIVDIEGRGISAACSTIPEAGMKVKTHTEEIMEMRRTSLELLLASHNRDCTACVKNNSCSLRRIAGELGVDSVRFKTIGKSEHIERTDALERNSSKCILCGDCVRACAEIQGIGAIDFEGRGAKTRITPAFGNALKDVDCVDCGQCARVCPTGAIVPLDETKAVMTALADTRKKVVAQIAPAVRVAIGEEFGLEPGVDLTGKIAAVLRRIGFAAVYDTSFTADLTVMEEGDEWLDRLNKGVKLPLITSCCPAWVKYAEQSLPDLLPNLSTCRSPQQMFGAIASSQLPEYFETTAENIFVVSVMPCTAKKAEARRTEFSVNGKQDVDIVLTTQELVRLIRAYGLNLRTMPEEKLDMPFGFKTGAGILFGTSGGVSEAVVRYAAESLAGVRVNEPVPVFREKSAIREWEWQLPETMHHLKTSRQGFLRIAAVQGLAKARALIDSVERGEKKYDLIEVMACPGGCVGGAGQPVSVSTEAREERATGIYKADNAAQLRHSQDNPYLNDYRTIAEKDGHSSLHTQYSSQRRILHSDLVVRKGNETAIKVSVCTGTACYLKGSQAIMQRLQKCIRQNNLENDVALSAHFCFEKCGKGPSVAFGADLKGGLTPDKAEKLLIEAIKERKIPIHE